MEIIQKLTGRTEIWFGKDPKGINDGKYCIDISETQMEILKVIGCIFLFAFGFIIGYII